MKRMLAALAGGLLIGVSPAYAESPDAAAKAKEAADLARAQEKAVANYRKNTGDSTGTRQAPASSSGATAAPKPEPDASGQSGADHAQANAPEKDLTRKEAQTEMPTPGQANDHSSTGRETVPSGR
jgi:hypothetical protein